MAASRVIHFDGWTLHRETGELERDGMRLRLQSQPLAVLEALLAQPGEMVGRDVLIARLWPRGVVDFDTALNSAVRRLRTALHDHADEPKYIETIPKRGYRFIGRLDGATPPTATDGIRVHGLGTLPASSHAPVPTVVPTPAHDLATSAPVAPPSLAAARRARTPARPTAIAIGIAVAGLFAGVLAWPALRGLDLAVPPSAKAQESVPAAAEADYRQARFLLERRGPGDVASARERFKSALELHPGFARAWSGISSTWWLDVVEHRIEPAQGLAASREAATRALELDPTIAEAHLRLANVAWCSGDRAAGDVHLRQAVAREPNDPLVLSFAASAAAARRDWSEAVALQSRAVEAEPLAGSVRHNLAVLLYYAGRYPEATAQLEELRTLNPRDTDSMSLLGLVLVLNGDFPAALAVAEQMEDAATANQVRALAYFALGRREESDRALRALTGLVEGQRAYLVAEVHAFRGEADAAFQWLTVATDAAPETCPPSRCEPLEWLPSSPWLRSLATDDRWSRWLARVRAHVSA